MMKPPITWITALVSGALVLSSNAVELPRMFSDHAVLQQGEIVPVWGWGNPGEAISVEFGGQKVAVKVGQNGEWRIEFKKIAADATGKKITGRKFRAAQKLRHRQRWSRTCQDPFTMG